jgi:hypothetical protein
MPFTVCFCTVAAVCDRRHCFHRRSQSTAAKNAKQCNYMLKLVSLDKAGRFDGGAFVFAHRSPAGD